MALLLERAGDAFVEGRPEETLERAEEALAVAPKSAAALHYKAAAQAELGWVGPAGETFERALAEAPADPELLRDAADYLLANHGEDRESVERAVELCVRGRKALGRKDEPELRHELLVLEGMAYNQLGECERALKRLDEALALWPESQDAALERAVALFELCRFEEAEKAFLALAEAHPDEASAHHHLGLLAERKQDAREAKRRFERARALAPEDFPAPVEMTEKEFDEVVEAALARFPEDVKPHLDHVALAVEDLPADEDLLGEDPPLSPCILGVFRGTPVGEQLQGNPMDQLPPAIVLYQKNLERFAKTREELIEQIGITIMHEVGHLLGLDEEDLWQRGLD